MPCESGVTGQTTEHTRAAFPLGSRLAVVSPPSRRRDGAPDEERWPGRRVDPPPAVGTFAGHVIAAADPRLSTSTGTDIQICKMIPVAIVLVGPPAAGKSTIGALLARALDRGFVDVDAVAAPLYAEVGWSTTRFQQLIASQGYEHAHHAWEPALTHAVERLVRGHPQAVIALGAGHTHCIRLDLRGRVAAALAEAERVVLLRPAVDIDESVRVLRERCIASKGHDWVRDGVDWLHRWCTDGCDEQFATAIVHTAGETAEQTLARLRTV